MQYIREYWSRSNTYRLLLILAALYVVLRLAFQVSLYTEVLDPLAVTEGAQVSSDLQQAYVTAAQRFQAREELYPEFSRERSETYYSYSPAFALFFQPVLLLPLPSLLPLTVLIHVAAYMLLYIWWSKIFEQNNLFHIGRQWGLLLPLYLAFSAFWDGLAYASIYVVMAMLATFLFDAILHGRLGAAVFWLAIMLLIEPHWVFVLALPLLLRKYSFFLKLLAGTALAYLVAAGITIMAGGVEYGIQQYQAYFGTLMQMARDYPWRGPDQPFLGYNHSLLQTVFYFLGISAGNILLVNLLKLVLLLPLIWVGLKFLRRSGQPAGTEPAGTILALFFTLYLGASLCLDRVWEVTLGIVIFAYLLATSKQKQAHVLLWVLFGSYALLDVWRVISYLAFGESILYQGSYVLTDPFLYIPWIMLIILIFYAVLLVRLDKLSVKLP